LLEQVVAGARFFLLSRQLNTTPEYWEMFQTEFRVVRAQDDVFFSHAGLAGHPLDIHLPSTWMEKDMASNIHPLRDRGGESEKITINLGYVDLGRLDLLVQEGFYSNRTDFIRTAIRNQLAAHADAVSQSIERHTLELGLRDFSRLDLEAVRKAGEMLHIKVVGLARIATDVTPELALATIASITVLGSLQAGQDVKAALAERIR
jgi:Arc/MetJ-type ribon-helix-helix transcriptional regulator